MRRGRYRYKKANLLRLGTVASGVGAPEVGAAGLRYKSVFVSEIEYFPCMVLHERLGAGRPIYPVDPSIFGDDADTWAQNNKKLKKIPAKALVPNFGDLTQLNSNWEKHAKECAPDVLVGGTPCQAFSISGLRGGLDDHRGNLSLEYAELCRKSGATWLVWENVLGALSSAGGDDFGAILACFAGYPAGSVWKPRGGKWKNSGVVEPATKGDFGLAWCVLDSRYFGVAQRRERLFIVGHRGDAAPAIAVLLDTVGLSGDSKPRQKEGKGAAGKTEGDTGLSGVTGYGIGPQGGRESGICPTLDTRCKDGPVRNQVGMALVAHGEYKEGLGTLRASGGDAGGGSEMLVAFCQQSMSEYASEDIASAIKARDFKGPTDLIAFNHQASVTQSMSVDEICPALDVSKTPAVCYGIDNACNGNIEVTNALMSARNGQVGHGAVVYPINTQLGLRGAETSNSSREGIGLGNENDPAFTLQASHPHGVAVAYGIQTAQTGSNGSNISTEVSPTLNSGVPAVAASMTVRRLTPIETERLQGFPDNWTRIEALRKKPNMKMLANYAMNGGRTLEEEIAVCAAYNEMTVEEYLLLGEVPDGPRYKAMGNSMTTHVLRWILGRIYKVNRILNPLKPRRKA